MVCLARLLQKSSGSVVVQIQHTGMHEHDRSVRAHYVCGRKSRGRKLWRRLSVVQSKTPEIPRRDRSRKLQGPGARFGRSPLPFWKPTLLVPAVLRTCENKFPVMRTYGRRPKGGSFTEVADSQKHSGPARKPQILCVRTKGDQTDGIASPRVGNLEVRQAVGAASIRREDPQRLWAVIAE